MDPRQDLLDTDAALEAFARAIGPQGWDTVLNHLCEEQPSAKSVLQARVEKSWSDTREHCGQTWFQTADWVATAPGVFIFRQRQFPGWNIELEFFFEGQPLLTQRFGDQKVDWPVAHRGQQIRFTHGMAEISEDLAVALATEVGLPDPFGAWHEARRLHRSLPPLGGGLTNTQRRVVARLTALGAEFGQSFAALASWLFPQPLAVRGNYALPPAAMPVVVVMEPLDDVELRLQMRWTAAPAKPVDRIVVLLEGQPVPATSSFDASTGELRIRGLKPDPEMTVASCWDADAGELQLRFATA